MASLMDSLQSGRPPITDAVDNLATLQLVHATYRSAAEHRSIRPAEL
jgi:predicted dehydrogenase